MERIVLEGSGTGAHESKLTGAMTGDSKNGVPCSFIVTKRGTGTWSLQNTRATRGAFYVQDGTLKFDSIGETNEVSALGYSTLLTENRGVAWTDTSAHVPYAFQLGATDADNAAVGKGMMEYAGTVCARVTTREAQVNGAGGFANNGGASFRLAGVTAGACTNNTLYLGGSGTNGNELQDLSGRMDIVKEGTGTWFLSGSNTVSGKVSVDGGTLWVRDPAKYTWFRWVVFNTRATTSEFRCTFFGLYDANDQLVSGDLGLGQNMHRLAPGEIHLDDDKVFRTVADGSTAVTNMVASSYRSVGKMYINDAAGNLVSPVSNATDRVKALVVLMRLKDGMNDAATYDFVDAAWGETGVYPSTPTDWMLEASADGQRWDTVAERREMYDGNPYQWDRIFRLAGTKIKVEASYSYQTHSGGEQLLRTRRDAADVLPVFGNVTSVKVAKGATLKTDAGADIALRGIEADAAGAGTIENFRIAESGTLAITGVEKGVREFKLPVTLVNVADAANFADWGFTINGAENPSWQMSVDKDGNVSFFKKGLVLIVR